MKPKNKNANHELYTYTEFKEKFFPKMKQDENAEDYLTRESFLDFLKKVSRPKKGGKPNGARKVHVS